MQELNYKAMKRETLERLLDAVTGLNQEWNEFLVKELGEDKYMELTRKFYEESGTYDGNPDA